MFRIARSAHSQVSSRSRRTRRMALNLLAAPLLALCAWLISAPAVQADTIPVNGTTCSLVDAITAANTNTTTGGCIVAGSGPDTLVLVPTTYTLSAVNNTFGFVGNNGLPAITSSITISGNGAIIERDSSLACTGAGAFRLFYIDGIGNLTLQDVTVRNGCVDNSGGGIYNNGSALTVQDSDVLSNTANSGAGGGIFSDGSSAVVTITAQSTIANNTANSDGGGIWNLGGALTVQDSQVLSNTAGLYGGGIHNAGGTLTVQNSDVLSNRSNSESGGGISSTGSSAVVAITAQSSIANNTANSDGGGIYNDVGALTVQNSQVLSNFANSDGGGIYSFGSSAVVTITAQSSIADNTANNNAGGGIRISGGALTVQDSDVLSNTANFGGGISSNGSSVVVTITAQSSIAANTAGDDGGGIYNDGGTLTVQDSDVLSNTASTHGGGILSIGSSAVVAITAQSSIANNTAGDDGGGIYNNGSALTVQDSDVLSNTANFGGGIYNTNGVLSITQSSLLDNQVSTGTGGALFQDNGESAVMSSCIVGNDDTAVFYNGGSPIVATANWWGSPDGPSGEGPGSGDSVSDEVIFAAALTAPTLGCPTILRNIALSKAAEPADDLRPGQPLTYTLHFTNTGDRLLQSIVLTDSLPAGVQVMGVTSATFGAGVAITQTQDAPSFIWQVSDLDPDSGGVITLTTVVSPGLSSDLTLTNTAVITADRDVTPTNNVAQVVQTVVLPRVQFGSPSYSAGEAEGAAIVTVTLDIANPYVAVTVDYASSDGSALATSDYTEVNDTLTITPGLTSAVIAIPLLDDAQLEPDEVFTVTLSSPSGAVLGTATDAQVFIINDDSEISIAALDADKSEGDSGTTGFTFVVSRTGYITAAATVDYAVSGSVNGADFVGGLPSGTLDFGVGEAETTLTLDVQGDSLLEADESFTVTLSDPSPNATIDTATAAGLIGNDDDAAALSVSKQASVALARVGEGVTYSYIITNSGGLTFTALSAVDEPLGVVTLGQSSLAPGESTTGQLVYTVVQDDLPGPLENTVTVTGTPIVGDGVVVSAEASVELVHAAFSFTKTAGIEGIEPECSANSTIQVPVSTTIVYCFTVTNTGSETLTTHTLEDDQLGTVLDGEAFDLVPGASFSISVTRQIFASVTNVAMWTSGYAGSDTVQVAALPAQTSAQATVNISDDDDDQDGDGIPDNLEQAGDVDDDNVPNFLDDDSDGDGRLDRDECPSLPCRDFDNDGIPDFLDPDNPTNLPPTEQPEAPVWLYLPSIGQ